MVFVPVMNRTVNATAPIARIKMNEIRVSENYRLDKRFFINLDRPTAFVAVCHKNRLRWEHLRKSGRSYERYWHGSVELSYFSHK
jgi:hypothetical protein